jgi:hypothetical protein
MYSTNLKMVKKLTHYGLFKPEKRVKEGVEQKLEKLIQRMQTPENLKKLSDALSGERWKHGKKPLPKMDFSKFEEKLNQAKKSYFSKLSDEEEGTSNENS